MAGYGPPRQSDKLRVLHGRKPRRPLDSRPPVGEMPTCPRWLRPEAKRIWREIGPELHARGALTVLDRAAFAIYCQSMADYRECVARLAREGVIIRGYRNSEVKHPLVSVAKGYLEMALQFGRDFGLTPVSRERLHLPEPDPEDWLERLLSGGKKDSTEDLLDS